MDIADYSRDMTAEAEAGLIEPPIGRDRELSFIFQTLAQSGKSSVLIKGPAGCGKTALAEGVAYHMVNNPEYRSHPRKRLVALDLTALNAGAMYVGQFEERISKFLAEARGDDGLVVFIDEIHMLMGFGKASSSGASRDLSQILKPPLARGEICCIGATTEEEFRRDIAPDTAFTRRFADLSIGPMEPAAVLKILQRQALKARYTSGLDCTERTLWSVIALSEARWPGRNQPDKAIDLLREFLATGRSKASGASGRGTKTTIEGYIQHIGTELTLLNRGDFEGLRKQAERWLGIGEIQVSVLDLDEAQIKARMASAELGRKEC